MDDILDGWHRDPFGRYDYRYFANDVATRAVFHNGVAAVDPVDIETLRAQLATQATSEQTASVSESPTPAVALPARLRLTLFAAIDAVTHRLGRFRKDTATETGPLGYAPRHAKPHLVNTAPAWTIAATGAFAVVSVVVALVASVATAPRQESSRSIPLANNALVQQPEPQRSAAPDFTAESMAGTASTPDAPTSPTPSAADAVLVSDLAANGIPTVALAAYRQAAAQYDAVAPRCKLSWPLLAAIGRVESNHGQFGGAVLHVDGTSTPRIIGIALNGVGTARIPATALGIQLDGDHQFDHAVGPMQIIPSTWASYALAATGHASADPFNIYDAAATAARYLCTAGDDLTTLMNQQRAVLAYNHSDDYLNTVLSLERTYAASANITVPATPTTTTPLPSPAPLPPANPGPPAAIATTIASAAANSSSPTAGQASSSSTTPTSTASTTTASSTAASTGSSASSSPTESPATASSAPASPTPTPSASPSPETQSNPAPTASVPPTPTPSPTAS